MNRPSLHDLHAASGGTHDIFSTKVAAYVTARPGYPAELFERLEALGALPPGAVVADLGAGTGLLSRSLLERGHRVFAVEPNDAMRAAAEEALGGFEGFRSLGGSAEATGLEDASVDLVTAAQAFHWFDPEASARECLRILKPAGKVALIWNDRMPTDPLQVELTRLLDSFGGKRRNFFVNPDEYADIVRFFGARPEELALEHSHRLDRAGWRALVFSRSYTPEPGTPEAVAAEREVDALFDRFADGETLTVHYRTVAYVGRPVRD